MIQLPKALALKSEDVSLVLRTHMVGQRELTPKRCPLTSTHGPWHVHIHTHTHPHSHKDSLWLINKKLCYLLSSNLLLMHLHRSSVARELCSVYMVMTQRTFPGLPPTSPHECFSKPETNRLGSWAVNVFTIMRITTLHAINSGNPSALNFHAWSHRLPKRTNKMMLRL